MPRAAKAKSTPKSAKDRKPSLRVQQASRFLAKNPQAGDEIDIDKALDELFTSIEPKASHNELETEDVMAYCQALDVNMGSYEYFVLADIVQAQSFGQITRQGFVKGWKQVYEDTGKRVPPDMAAHQKYVRAQINLLRTDAAFFSRVYRTAFTTGKELGKREMGMTEALAYWEELFKPTMGGWKTEHVDWLAAWTAYLREKFGTSTDGDWEYSRTVSKDLWNQTRLFAAKTMEDETLGFWSEEQAWPGLIDEFVVWCREKGKVPAQNGEAMEVEE